MLFDNCKLGMRNIAVPYLISAFGPIDRFFIPFRKGYKACWWLFRTMPFPMLIMCSTVKLLDSLFIIKTRDVVWTSCNIAKFPIVLISNIFTSLFFLWLLWFL
eukprot:Gb_34655 [translate_table: standard]